MTDRYINRLNRNSKYFKALNPVWDEYSDDGLNVFEMIDELNWWDNEYQTIIKEYDEVYDTLQALLECFTCQDCINCIGFDDGYGVDFKCKRTDTWGVEDNEPCYHFRKCKIR